MPFLFLLSCMKTEEVLIGKWKIEAVVDKDRKALLPISSGDYMELTDKGIFTKILYDAEIESTGKWELKKKEIHFTQTSEDSARTETLIKYKVEVLEVEKMVLSKGDTIYTFKK